MAENEITDLQVFKIVSRAKTGDPEYMDRLTELASGRVFAYIYRITVDYELAQDLTQQTLTYMIESLKALKNDQSFWAWLFKTAFGKVHHYYRKEKRMKTANLSDYEKNTLVARTSDQFEDGLTKLMREELSETIFKAVKKLKIKYRNVLSLRCFEQMPYSEIAEIMNCNEVGARILFHRAKKSLWHELRKNGYNESMLLSGLTLFGIITAASDTTAKSYFVTAALIETSALTALASILVTKTCAFVGTMIAASVIYVNLPNVAILVFVLFCILFWGWIILLASK